MKTKNNELQEVNEELSNDQEKPLVSKKYKLERFPGKGGWTYAKIPEVIPDKKAPFGWVKVRGSIDGYQIKNHHLMPMGNGQLFLTVKSTIRKAIGKEEGDWVDIVLYHNKLPLEIPEELMLCLLDEPKAHQTFLSYSQGEQKAYIDWIFSAKKEETLIERIAKTIDRLLKNLKFGENK